MRAVAISNADTDHARNLIDQMHRLRARIFGGRLGWNVRSGEGRELVEYDRPEPTYILAVTSTDTVVGRSRLPPAADPTILERTFPQRLDGWILRTHRGVRRWVRHGSGTSYPRLVSKLEEALRQDLGAALDDPSAV